MSTLHTRGYRPDPGEREIAFFARECLDARESVDPLVLKNLGRGRDSWRCEALSTPQGPSWWSL